MKLFMHVVELLVGEVGNESRAAVKEKWID